MIKYAVVEDNQVTETFTGLPLSWRNTSGFNLIGDDVEVLRTFGWYPVELIIPTYDDKEFNLSQPTVVYDIENDKVTATFTTIPIEREPASELQRRYFVLLRDNRNQKLKDCDWAVMQDVVESRGTSWYNSWKVYRQALRDLPDTVSFKEDEYPPDFYTSVNWPQEPSVS